MYSEIKKILIVFLMSAVKPVFSVSHKIRTTRDTGIPSLAIVEPISSDNNNISSDLTVRKFSSRIINILLKNSAPIPSNKFHINQKKTVRRSATDDDDTFNLNNETPSTSATIFRKFQSMDFSDQAEHQFCGETLFYAVEYYCVYIKGTGVYTADYEFESTYVMGAEDEEMSRRQVKQTQLKGTFLNFFWLRLPLLFHFLFNF